MLHTVRNNNNYEIRKALFAYQLTTLNIYEKACTISIIWKVPAFYIVYFTGAKTV